jgi:hypothetical protein
MTVTDEQLNAIEARLNEYLFSINHPERCKIDDPDNTRMALFVLQAPGDIAALLAEVERLRARVAELDKMLLASDYVVIPENDNRECKYCDGSWGFDQPEHHKPNGPIAQARAELEQR